MLWVRSAWILCFCCSWLQATAVIADPSDSSFQRPISIHPHNPKYFLFRDRPLALITATEHYGSVVNASFDFERYLKDAADKKQTLTRIFLLFRELQSPRNPSSPIKPESPDYLSPYPRIGSEKALDGEAKYDLDQWNPGFFKRLHQFLKRASGLGIVVEVTFFSSTYTDQVWSLSPLHAANNVNGLQKIEWFAYNTLRDPQLFQRQASFTRKIIRETNQYDNIYYDICNEAGVGLQGHVSPAEVDQWQSAIFQVMREEMDQLPHQHLVFGAEATSLWGSGSHNQRIDESFENKIFDAVNLHSMSGSSYAGRFYRIGDFMSKQLVLAELRDLYQAIYHEKKPVVMDEDNAASMYRDQTGWTIHRKRAWTTLMSGAHYDYIDFSITVGNETGTGQSRQMIRTWMKHLSEFFHSFDFIRARPLVDWVQGVPDSVVESVLGIAGEEYIVYLADAREVTDPAAGEMIQATLGLPLPRARYQVRLFSPVSGSYSPAIWLHGGADAKLDLPPFTEDLVIRVKKIED
ncbi:MAG: hypothetical protein CMJ62_01070 [Planctomycetaceae bacterium]|nr:hypothetical protein [Planctomycetaceae bacterium]